MNMQQIESLHASFVNHEVADWVQNISLIFIVIKKNYIIWGTNYELDIFVMI